MYEELEFWKKHKEEKELQSKIAQEYGLFNECGFQYKEKAKENVSKLKVNDNSFMLIDNSNKSDSECDSELDEWMNDLIKRNGTTEYQKL